MILPIARVLGGDDAMRTAVVRPPRAVCRHRYGALSMGDRTKRERPAWLGKWVRWAGLLQLVNAALQAVTGQWAWAALSGICGLGFILIANYPIRREDE